jgi:hypothetical protein
MCSRRRRPFPTRADDQCGAIAGEHVAVLLVVALLVGVLFRIGLPTTVGDWSRYAVCELFGSGTCELPQSTPVAGRPSPGSSLPTDEDYLPSACMLRMDSEQAGVQVKLAFISFGEDYGFVRQEYADGRVRLTIVNEASLGAEWSPDAKLIDLGSLGSDEVAAATVKVGAGLTFGYGDTWEFASPAEELAMRQQLDDYLIQQVVLSQPDAWAMYPYLWLTDGFVDPPKDPAVTFSTMEVSATGEAALGLRSPIDRAADGQDRFLDPSIGAALELDGSYKVVIETDRATGHRSYTYSLKGSAGARADVTVGRGGVEGSTTGSFKVTRDERGELVAIELLSTRQGTVEGSLGGSNPVGGSGPSGRVGSGETTAVVTRTRLDLDDRADREIVERWLQDNSEQFGVPLRLTYDQLLPTERVPGDAFQSLLHDRASVSRIVYDDVDDVHRFGLEVKVGLQFGFSVHQATKERSVREASFLGAPDAGGVRTLIEDATCR